MNNHSDRKQEALTALQNSRKHLVSLSEEMIEELENAFSGDLAEKEATQSDKVSFIEIQYFVDGYRMSFYAMDKEFTQLGYKKLLKKYSNGLLQGYDFTIDTELYDLNSKDDNKEMDDFFNKQQKIFFEWLLTCWDRASKKNLKTPVYLMEHDSEKAFDLQNKKWVEN